MSEQNGKVDSSEKQNNITTSPGKRRRWLQFIAIFFCAFLVAVVCLIGAEEVMAPLSTAEFCVSCHEMDEVHASWKESPHHTNASGVRVTCVSCHLPPREKFTAYMTAKTSAGVKDAFIHYFGEYDVEKARQTVRRTLSNERCLHCHDNMTGRPSTTAVGAVHASVIEQPSDGAYNCLACHRNLHGSKPEPPWKMPRDRADNTFCFVCHLNFDGEEFVAAHQKGGVGCMKCHGESLDHADDEDHTTPPDTMYAKAAVNASCATADCHEEAKMKKVISHEPYYDGADAKRQYCTDCHGNHRIEERHRKWDRTTRELIWRDGYTVDGAGGM